MPYDTFVIYFLFFPTLTLVLGILVSHPRKVIRNFVLSAGSTALFLVSYFFMLESLLVSSGIKTPNLYFSHTWYLGSVSLLKLGYYFLVPWFIGSVCLLANRIPKTKEWRKSRQLKKLSPLFWGINLVLGLNLGLLYLSLESPAWYNFRFLSLNFLWSLPCFNGFLYFRSKKSFHHFSEINWAGVGAGLYTLTGTFFVSEPLYLFDWYALSPLWENTLFIILTFLMATETLILFSYLWHSKSSSLKLSGEPFVREEWLSPFLSPVSVEEKEMEAWTERSKGR